MNSLPGNMEMVETLSKEMEKIDIQVTKNEGDKEI